MRKNFGSKPMCYHIPVYILAAWGGISDNAEISICDSAEHKTTKNILARKAFTYDPMNHKYLALGTVVGNAFKDCLAIK